MSQRHEIAASKLKQLKSLDLESLGAEMLERKTELMAEMGIESDEEEAT